MKERILIVLDGKDYKDLSKALEGHDIKSALQMSETIPEFGAGIVLNSDEYRGRIFSAEKLLGVTVMGGNSNIIVQGDLSKDEFLDLFLGLASYLIGVYIKHFQVSKEEAIPWFKELFAALVERVDGE